MAKKSYIGIADTYLFLDYIQLTGTQYINTGWYANGDTTIELDMYAEITSGVVYYFIGQNGGFGTSSEFVVRKLGSRTYVTSDFGSEQLNASDIIATTGRHTIIKAKNTMSFDGVTVTHDITQMTNTKYPSLLLASTTSAGVMTPCPGKIYSCRIYDGETLVRDFVPCKKTSGAIGLYDRVNGTFYANAGSDSFIAGTETGETLALGSVARSVKGYGYVENGINNVVKKIYAEVNGVARLFYSGVTPISTVPSQSGSLTYSGSAQEPAWSNYDASTMTIGGTTSATNAGTYNATFTPKDGYCWSDGTTTAKTVSWKIGKATYSTKHKPSQKSGKLSTGLTIYYNSLPSWVDKSEIKVFYEVWEDDETSSFESCSFIEVSSYSSGVAQLVLKVTDSSAFSSYKNEGYEAITLRLRVSDPNYNNFYFYGDTVDGTLMNYFSVTGSYFK